MLITPEYAALNRQLHATSDTYGTSGHKWADQVFSLAQQCGALSVLDYGAGKCTLGKVLFAKYGRLPFEFIEYDPAVPEKEHKPGQVDMVVCGDVLEHIEPDCLYAVLDDIRSIARKAVFLMVATQPAAKFLADGRNAHLIVEPIEWWLPKLMLRWRVKLLRDFGGQFMMVGAPK